MSDSEDDDFSAGEEDERPKVPLFNEIINTGWKHNQDINIINISILCTRKQEDKNLLLGNVFILLYALKLG